MGCWRGNYSRGLFLLLVLPIPTGRLANAPLPAIPRVPHLDPGPGPAALPAQRPSFLGLEETCWSWLGNTKLCWSQICASANCLSCVGCEDGSRWSSTCRQPGTDRNGLEEKREKEAPSSSHCPSCIRPLPPPFPHIKYWTEYFTDLLKYVERLFPFLTEDNSLSVLQHISISFIKCLFYC